MRQHIDILGWLFVVMGALGFVTAVIVFAAVGAGGLLTGDAKVAALLTGIGFFIAVLVAIFSVPNIVVGWGLLKRKGWSRIAALILGCLGLLSFPLGTVLGIYALWVLTKPEAQALLSS
jgi:zinc transporter ZupT